MDHPRRNDLDAVGIRAVELLELRRLGGGVGEDGVGAPDDLGLGIDAPLRLEVARLGLDPCQGVERRHQRQVQLVLEAMPGDAREPVVGMEGVGGVGATVGGEPRQHTVGELVDDLGEGLLGQVDGPRRNVHHPEPRLDVDDVGQPIGPAPDVDVARHAGLGERRDQLAYVDVHAAAVAGPRLDERRRVQGKDRESSHQEPQRPPSPRDS